MPRKKLRIIMKAFVSSQFAYCPLIWMFHSRQINHKINKIHHRALRIVYNDHFSSFEKFLSKDKSVTVHQRSLQILSTEMNNKLIVTTIKLVMRQNLPQESLKRLDMDYRPSLTWLQKFEILYLKRWNKLLLWMNSRSKSSPRSQKTVPGYSVELTFDR